MLTSAKHLALDIAIVVGVAALGVAAVLSVYGLPREASLALIALLASVALVAVFFRVAAQPDHVRALQSHRILLIANESLAHLRQGLNQESAQLVCRLALDETEVDAVAITDCERVLGFAGLGEEHHTVGGPILTRATHESLKMNEHRILSTPEEIGCPKKDCPLAAAIVVPLRVRGVPVGTLKFYYGTRNRLNETQLTMAEGLAQLLSTQLEASELEMQTELATRMELKALQAQIDPHFLFNTINTIASMIRTDPPKARDLLREFAAFYRHTLDHDEALITLEREMDYVRRYLVFERARFGDESLRLVEEVPAHLGVIHVPAFVLQPLVENAVQHGMVSGRPLNIKVSVEEEPPWLSMSVEDDGRGMKPEEARRALEPGFGTGLGIALKNVDDRLRGHFGPDSGLIVSSRFGQGTTVTARIRRPAEVALQEDGKV